jgi:hypothetical protein
VCEIKQRYDFCNKETDFLLLWGGWVSGWVWMQINKVKSTFFVCVNEKLRVFVCVCVCVNEESDFYVVVVR